MYSEGVNTLILYEDESIIAVNKPAGMLAQDDSTGRPSVAGIVRKYLEEKATPDVTVYCPALHRLDRPVSGVMLFAKNLQAAGRLSSDIKDRRVRRFYCAIVTPALEVMSTESWVGLNQLYTRRRDRAYIVGENASGAVDVSLRYRVMKEDVTSGLVLVELVTGKRHQVRVQLASIGSPVSGDSFYGSAEKAGKDIIMLHAHFLCFTHPVTDNSLTVCAPLPLYMKEKINFVPCLENYMVPVAGG